MTKAEMIEVLKSVKVPVNEAISKSDTEFPRIIYWDSIWEDVMASGADYATNRTYTIWFFSDRPVHPKLIELKKALNGTGLHPIIYHERTESGVFQSYFSLEVIEDV